MTDKEGGDVMIGTQELLVILLIVFAVFGGKKILEIMSGLGHGIKSFKKALDEEDKPGDEKS